METLFFQYPPCSTCRKAAKWLADHHIEVTARYRELKLKERIPVSSPDELIALLASDGMLIKRPLLVTDTHVLAGFDPKRWEEALCPQSR